MKHLLSLLSILLLLITNPCWAQETYIEAGSEEIELLKRMETLSGQFSNHLFLDNPFVSRKDMYYYLLEQKSNPIASGRTNIDYYNLNKALNLSQEYSLSASNVETTQNGFSFLSSEQIDFLRVQSKNFSLVLNPIVGLSIGGEMEESRSLMNTAVGLEARSIIADRVALYVAFTYQHENPFSYQKAFAYRWKTIPGTKHEYIGGNQFEYFKWRGNANLALIKNHLSLNVGYNTHFIGDGFRSLFLSDFAGGAWYGSFETKVWKLNYRNIYLKLAPQSIFNADALPTNKYATVHHLSVNVFDWLNIGVFEAVTFVRYGGYELSYLNPVIFYRSVERALGSPDKAAIGLDVKVIPFKSVKLYSQFLINEFTSKEFFSRKGYWANKWALQLGAQYYNAFTIPNLDLQAEVNLIRPYTYTHYKDTEFNNIANYTHHNLSLAHPLGAGLAEVLGRLRYQPAKKWTIDLMAMYYQQGVDTGGKNFGNNILLDYRTRNSNYGVSLVNGPVLDCIMGTALLSYQIRPRLNIDLSAGFRKVQSEFKGVVETTDVFGNIGVRLNLNRQPTRYLF